MANFCDYDLNHAEFFFFNVRGEALKVRKKFTKITLELFVLVAKKFK